jgi:hypothetical protein
MSALSKAIAVSLIVMAVIATGYTGYFASEYTASLSALVDFSADLDFDPSDVRYNETYDVHYILVNVSMNNPSDIDIMVYEVNLALFLMNSSTGEFHRIGDPASCFCEYPPMKVPAGSGIKRTFGIIVDDAEDFEWNANRSGGDPVVDPYMEIRYRVSNYDFTNMRPFGHPHYSKGRGPFD